MSPHGLRTAVSLVAILLAGVPAMAGLCPESADCPMRRAETVDDCHAAAPGREASAAGHSAPTERPPAQAECCAAHAPERIATATTERSAPPEPAAFAPSVPCAGRADLAAQVAAGARPPGPPLPPLLPREGSASLCTLHVTFLN